VHGTVNNKGERRYLCGAGLWMDPASPSLFGGDAGSRLIATMETPAPCGVMTLKHRNSALLRRRRKKEVNEKNQQERD